MAKFHDLELLFIHPTALSRSVIEDGFGLGSHLKVITEHIIGIWYISFIIFPHILFSSVLFLNKGQGSVFFFNF
jgi:hypothetical protein